MQARSPLCGSNNHSAQLGLEDSNHNPEIMDLGLPTSLYTL